MQLQGDDHDYDHDEMDYCEMFFLYPIKIYQWFSDTWLTSTTRWSRSCSIIKSQTVVFPDAAPPATPRNRLFRNCEQTKGKTVEADTYQAILPPHDARNQVK